MTTSIKKYPFPPFSDVFIHAKTHNGQFISSGEIADQATLKFDRLHIFCAETWEQELLQDIKLHQEIRIQKTFLPVDS